MSTPVCVHCGQPTRFRLGDVFECKGGCAKAPPPPNPEYRYSEEPMTVTAPEPPPDLESHAFVPQPRDSRYCNVCDKSAYSHPEPESEPEPKPKASRYPWRRKR